MSNNNPKYNSKDYWISQIRSAKEHRSDHSFESRWDEIEDWWAHKGDQFQGDMVSFNACYMYGGVLIPSLIFNRPRIINTARDAGPFSGRKTAFMPIASIYDSLNEFLMDELEAVESFKSVVLDGYLKNVGAIEIGYDFPDFSAFTNQDFEPVEADVDRARKKSMPWIDVIPPRQLLLDPSAKSERKLKWYGKVLFRPTRHLKMDSNLNQEFVKPTHFDDEYADDAIRKMYRDHPGPEEWTMYYEIHEAEEGTWCWLTEEGFLYGPTKDNLQVDGLPIELLRFNVNPNSLWGTPDPIYIEPQMLDGNETRRIALSEKRMSTVKILADSGIFDDDEIEKVKMSGNPILRTRKGLPPTKSIRDAVMVLNPPAPFEFFTYEQHLVRDMDMLLGYSVNQRGQLSSSRNTKAEVEFVNSQVSLRLDDRRNRLAKVIERTFAKLNQVIASYWDRELLQRVVGQDGAIYFVQFKPTDLKMELTTKVEVESMLPRNSEREKNEIANIMNILSKVPNANVMPLLTQLLSKFPWADVQQLLPQANNGLPVNLEQFTDQQNASSQDPNLGQRVQGNLAALAAAGGSSL